MPMPTKREDKTNNIDPRFEVQGKCLHTLALMENAVKGLSRQILPLISEDELDIKKRETSMVLLDTWFGYAPKRASIRPGGLAFDKSDRERN